MNHYAPQIQKKVKADIDAEIAKLSENRRELLRHIFESMHMSNLNDTARLQVTMARFATMLVSLSIQADKLQRWMIIFTVAITVMTLIIIGLAVPQYLPYFVDAKPNP